MNNDIWQGSAFSKRDVSTAQRHTMAEHGTAMPDGSFPIATVADLHNAIQSIGRAAHPEAAKAHIKRRAAALGATDQLPDTWKMDDSMNPTQTYGEGYCTPKSADCMNKLCKVCGAKR